MKQRLGLRKIFVKQRLELRKIFDKVPCAAMKHSMRYQWGREKVKGRLKKVNDCQ